MSGKRKHQALFEDDNDEEVDIKPPKRQKVKESKTKEPERDSSEDEENNIVGTELTINEKFAKEYASKKRHEELSKSAPFGYRYQP